MWICKDCGASFEKPTATRDMNGSDHYTLSLVCPDCSSENIEQLQEVEDAPAPEM